MKKFKDCSVTRDKTNEELMADKINFDVIMEKAEMGLYRGKEDKELDRGD